MVSKIDKAYAEVIQIARAGAFPSCGYNMQNLLPIKRLLNAIAVELGILQRARVNYTDVGLHGDRVHIFSGAFGITYRECNGEKDYTGGQNHDLLAQPMSVALNRMQKFMGISKEKL